jgi:hypothetical protein
MTDKELARLIESNAKAIEALTNDIQEMRRDRQVMYELMGDLTNKMGELVISQTKSYKLMESLDNRQHQLTNQQQMLIEIVKKLAEDK